MKPFRLEIVTPGRVYPARRAVALDVPAHYGRLTVLPGHQPLTCRLRAGRMKLTPADGEAETWEIESGTLGVSRDQVTVLVRAATPI